VRAQESGTRDEHTSTGTPVRAQEMSTQAHRESRQERSKGAPSDSTKEEHKRAAQERSIGAPSESTGEEHRKTAQEKSIGKQHRRGA
jgi:hypothetical protein